MADSVGNDSGKDAKTDKPGRATLAALIKVGSLSMLFPSRLAIGCSHHAGEAFQQLCHVDLPPWLCLCMPRSLGVQVCWMLHVSPANISICSGHEALSSDDQALTNNLYHYLRLLRT